MARKPRKRLTGAIGRIFPGIAVFAKCLGLIYSRRSMLRKLGYIESVKERRPCRRDGSPIPWMNYNVISFLEGRLKPALNMFEYGSGNSTLFYAKLVGSVTSLEADKDWYEYGKSNLPDNVTLLYSGDVSAKEYANTIAEQNTLYDVVIIDAKERVECFYAATKCLTQSGVIVLDDSHRDYYQDAFDFAEQQGFRRLDFEGLKPAGIREYRSTVFYKSDNCLGI